MALCLDTDATLGDVREAVTTLEELERIARRVFGGAHPVTVTIEDSLKVARSTLEAVLRALAKSARGPRTGL